MKAILKSLCTGMWILAVFLPHTALAVDYPIVDTGQSACYDNSAEMDCSSEGENFYGQDAHYTSTQASYTDNGDGTITDNVTGLMWEKGFSRATQTDAAAGASTANTGGYDDWRLPTIKELYSLMMFYGTDPSGYSGSDTSVLTPFVNTDYFDFEYGDVYGGRTIDSQYWSSNVYVSTVMGGETCAFGLNLADGRIKCYELNNTDRFVRYVRGTTSYGVNDFTDNGDQTITDNATGLMWMKRDSGHLSAGSASDGKLTWREALAWAEGLTYAGYSDWRLPDAKELQSLVDYSRSPDTTNSPAIDALFRSSTLVVEDGVTTDYPFYWASTTHISTSDGSTIVGDDGVYIAFGQAFGWLSENNTYSFFDVHGAGAQRSDPKTGDPDDYPYGHGPQGDVIRIENFARLVRGGDARIAGSPVFEIPYMNNDATYKTFLKITNFASTAAELSAEIMIEDGTTYTLGDLATIAADETLLINGSDFLDAGTYGAGREFAMKILLDSGSDRDQLIPASVMKTAQGQRVIPVYRVDAESTDTTTVFSTSYLNSSATYSTVIKMNNWSDTDATVSCTIISSDGVTKKTGTLATVDAGTTTTWDAEEIASPLGLSTTTYPHFSAQFTVSGPTADNVFMLVFQDSASGDRVIPVYRDNSCTDSSLNYF